MSNMSETQTLHVTEKCKNCKSNIHILVESGKVHYKPSKLKELTSSVRRSLSKYHLCHECGFVNELSVHKTSVRNAVPVNDINFESIIKYNKKYYKAYKFNDGYYLFDNILGMVWVKNDFVNVVKE